MLFSQKNSRIDAELLYLNKPLEEEKLDGIGVSTYVDNIKAAIKKGAKMIAVTSDFGSGKSSITNFLEKRYSWFIKLFRLRFCKINLWCHLNGDNNILELHKTFLYQLTTQISPRKGSYISKRLNKNFGLLKIETSNKFFTIVAFIAVLFATFSIIFKSFGEEIVILWPELESYIDSISIGTFALAIFFSLSILLKDGLIFSSKNSEGTRQIEESEVMDIYQTKVIKSLFPMHYIVVIEDLDRTNDKQTIQFIKELRKYYIPERKKFTLSFLKSKVTFIVNIKPEAVLSAEDHNNKESLYSKIFDYIVELKTINIDNYDTILENLIIEKKTPLEKVGFHINNKNNINEIPGMQWIIRGKNIGLREIKERWNATFLLYNSLIDKFGYDKIIFEKCAVVAYLTNAFGNDFYNMDDKAFERMVDYYISEKIENTDEINEFINGSQEYIDEVKKLLVSKLITSDYRTYFYNYPKGSYLYSVKETQVRDAILYDEPIDDDFEKIVEAVHQNNQEIILRALDKVISLGLYLPKVVFKSDLVYRISLSIYKKKTIDSFIKHLSEREVELPQKIDTIKRVLSYDNNRDFYDMNVAREFCELWLKVFPQSSINKIRKMICEEFQMEILWYKSLFFGANSLITKDEINIIQDVKTIIDLINMDSEEITVDFIDSIDNKIITLDLEKIPCQQVEKFYLNILEQFENNEIIDYLVKYMKKIRRIVPEFETILIEEILINDTYLEEYIEIINLSAIIELTDNTIKNVKTLNICKDLNEEICQQLYAKGEFLYYIYNLASIDIEKINLSDDNIQKMLVVKSATIHKENPTLWYRLRYMMLDKYIKNIDSYLFMWGTEYKLISKEELGLINDMQLFFKLIDDSQVTEENVDDIAEYFSKSPRNSNDTYTILNFVANLTTPELSYDMFYKLDMKNMKYSKMSKKRKKHIKEQFADILHLLEPLEIIKFMQHTEKLDEELEKIITAYLNEEDDEVRNKYVNLINSFNDHTKATLSNIIHMKYLYEFSDNINKKLFEDGAYLEYVVSLVLKNRSFIIEYEKIDILWETYVKIIGSSGYETVRDLMSQNKEFLNMLMKAKSYISMPEENRLYLAKTLQSVESLENIMTYGIEFAIKYLRVIEGFDSMESVKKIISLIEEHDKIAADSKIYKNVYLLLNDKALKSKYTRIHNKAK